MSSEHSIHDYIERLEAALLEYVEKYGPTESAKAVFRDAPLVARTAWWPACAPEGGRRGGEDPAG